MYLHTYTPYKRTSWENEGHEGVPVLKLKLGFTRGSDFSPSSSQDRSHHGYQPALLLLGISKRPPLFPVVKLCLSELQKPSLPLPRPTPICRSWSYFYPVTCMLSPPPRQPRLHTHVGVAEQTEPFPPLGERGAALRRERAAGLASLFPAEAPSRGQLLPHPPPPSPALQGSPSLGWGQLARPQMSPHPLRWTTCSGCPGGGMGVGGQQRPGEGSHPWWAPPLPLILAAKGVTGEMY